eukprot:scaffold6.g2706.t1
MTGRRGIAPPRCRDGRPTDGLMRTPALRAVAARPAPSPRTRVVHVAAQATATATVDAKQLNKKFGQAGAVEVTLFGGCVTSWKTAAGREVLYIRPDAVFDKSKPISGGIPHCFPQARAHAPPWRSCVPLHCALCALLPQRGSRASGARLSASICKRDPHAPTHLPTSTSRPLQFGPGAIQLHGFARNVDWELAGAAGGAAPSAQLVLTDNAYTKAMWPHSFRATYTVTLDGEDLLTELEVADAKHPTVHTELREAVTFRGPVDAVYRGSPGSVRLDAGAGDVTIDSTNWPDVVVWTPWTAMEACYHVESTPSLTRPLSRARPSRQNVSVLLAGEAPRFTAWSSSPAAGWNASDTPNVWLVIELRGVAELDASGAPVALRGGNDLLDLLGDAPLAWKVENATVGQPAVAAQRASLLLPFKSSVPDCGGATPLDMPATGADGSRPGVTLEVLLFGAGTNFSAAPSLANATVDVLPGNLKYSVRVDGWPFCFRNDSLAFEIAVLASNASANGGVTAQNGADIAKQLAQEEADLTGASDPASVPVNASAASTSSAADAATSDALQQIDSVLAAAGGGDGNVTTSSLGGSARRRRRQLLRTSSSSRGSRSSGGGSSGGGSRSSGSSSSGSSSSGSKTSTSTGGSSGSSSSSSSSFTGSASSGSKGTSTTATRIGALGAAGAGGAAVGAAAGYTAGTYASNKATKAATAKATTTTPSGTTVATRALPKTTRPYWPSGGTSRPRYATPYDAINGLPFTRLQQTYLTSRYLRHRPVYGYGIRPWMWYSTWLFWPCFGLYSWHCPSMDVYHTAVVNNYYFPNGTLALTTTAPNATAAVPQLLNITVQARREARRTRAPHCGPGTRAAWRHVLPQDASGMQPLQVVLPAFGGQAVWDPVVSLAEGPLVISDATAAAIDNVMGYTQADEDGSTDSTSTSSTSAARGGVLPLLLALAAAVAAVL